MALSEMWQWLDVAGNITLALMVATVGVIVYYIITCFRSADNWEKYGVKHVALGKEAFQDFRLACRLVLQEHGDTVGTITRGMSLLTRDLDILRMVMVKDFNNFADREVAYITKSHVIKGVFFLGGQDWKRVRHVISPSFSSGKIKGFLPSVNGSAVKLAKVMEEHAKDEKQVAIKHLAGQYTSEIIAKLAFGLHTDCIGKEDDEFTHFSKTLFKIRTDIGSMIMLIMFRFPKLLRFLVKTLKIEFFDRTNKDADVYFNTVLHRTIAERKELVRNGKKLQNDFLQSLVVAKEEGDKEVAAAAAATGSSVAASEENLPKTITDEELIGQALLIIFAGFETTSTALQFLLYLLAKHPDVQEKLFEEIESTVQSEVPTYEELGQLKYMDQVINETLRLYPPAPIMTRKALETRTYGNITIPKGAAIIIPLDLIMMDPKHYEDPEKFDPDRFTEENKAKRDPMAFVPFGYGPRLCIGMRLALLELKIGLVNMVRKVRFELDEKTKNEELKVKYQGVLLLDKPLLLTCRLRT